MTAPETRPHASLTQTLIQNWISFAGLVVVAASFFAFALLMAIDLSSGFSNPYVGIFTYLVAPAFLILGLAMMVGGLIVERLRRHRRAPEIVPKFPRLDLNSPRHRKVLAFGSGATAVFLLATAFGSYGSYHFSESESRDVVAYMEDELRDFDAPKQILEPLRVNQTLAESGQKLFRRYGCFACHDPGAGAAERFGPDLDGIGDKKAASLDFGRRGDLPRTLPAWLGAKLASPRSFARRVRD